MKLLSILTLFTITALIPCSGAVIYNLSGTSPNGAGTFALDFQLTTPAFITTNISNPAASLDSCTTGFEVCDHVDFQPVSSHDANSAHIEFFTTTSSTLFFFDLGFFSAPGTYNTTFGAGTGTLTVEETSDVPEPATVALTLCALAGLLAIRCVRR